jgi:hypothetical protein
MATPEELRRTAYLSALSNEELRNINMSSAQSRAIDDYRRDVNQYLEPTLLGQGILSQNSLGSFTYDPDFSIYDGVEAPYTDSFGIDISYPEEATLETLLGPNDFFEDYYSIEEFREVNRRQVLQQTVPVFQIALRTTLLQAGLNHYMTVEEYLYDLFRMVCQRRGIDALGQGYCQLRVEPFENMWDETRTQTYQHGFATVMTPLEEMNTAIANILNSISQSESELTLDDMLDVTVQYYFTFVLTRNSDQINANVVTEAASLHHLKDRHRLKRRGQMLALKRFTRLEEERRRRGGLLSRGEQYIRPDTLKRIRESARNDLRRDLETERLEERRRRNNEAEFAQQEGLEQRVLNPDRPQRPYRPVQGRRGRLPREGAPTTNLQKWYANMTPEERRARRREYNRRYRNNNQIRGLYEEYRKRLFHHTSVEEYFTFSKAILQVPNTYDQGYCMAMAFLRSQCCVTEVQTGQMTESRAVEHIHSDDELHWIKTVEVLPQFAKSFLRPFSFTKRQNENGYYSEIVLFNPYRSKSEERTEVKGCMRYENEVSAQEALDWYVASQNFHAYVVTYFRLLYEDPEFNLDPNEEDVLTYYATATQTAVAIYRTEFQAKRVAMYYPMNWELDLRKQKYLPIVSILLHDGHALAITNLREFVQGKATANRTHVNSFCPICQRIRTSNNCTKQECAAHFVQCLEKNEGMIENVDRIHLRHVQVDNYTPPMCRYNRKKDCYVCTVCRQDIVGPLQNQMDHVCEVQCATLKIGESKHIYVYDFESAQIPHETELCVVHEVNLVCCRRAYSEDGEDRTMFHSIDDFMKYVLSFTEEKRIYIAHNGGRYDVQFVMRYLERNLIPHDFVPTPSSMHAYLSVTVPFGANKSAIFLDFRNFMPSSLKSIAISFGLSNQKGDFPHKFNNGSNTFYEGCIPSITHADDYWCLETKRTEEEVDEFFEFYKEQQEIYCTCLDMCCCSKKKWNFQEQIQKYCWLDVDVLAEACMRYRENALSFGVGVDVVEAGEWVSQGIDPYEYLTIPQVAINLLLNGRPDDGYKIPLAITPTKVRSDRSPRAVIWLERLMFKNSHIHIRHIGNSNREFYCYQTKRYADGFDGHKVYICLQCEFHACPECYYEELQIGKNHPTRNATFSTVHNLTKNYIGELLATYGPDNVEVKWEHEIALLTEYESNLSCLMKERDMFYGGRTEVFSPYCNVDYFPHMNIHYYDVCSLYPYVCAFKTLPTGTPQHIFGIHIQRERLVNLDHPDPYFGYVRCFVIPNRKCYLGLLPYRDPLTGRLEFPLTPMMGSWGTEELRIAIEQGYIVEDIYEVYHWNEENRSDKLLRGYVAFFLQMKQEAEGWKKMGASSEDPSDEEKLAIQEKVYRESGCIAKIRIDQVKKNPVRRQMAKIYLNSLWGKFCQKPSRTHYVTIHGYQQFAELWFHPHIDKSTFSFRHLAHDTWKVKYETYENFTTPNAKYNIFLASKVTEWARCILHRQMLRIGPQHILYCDTDSILFLYPKQAENLEGCGLGQWINEYPEKRITRLYALAPKFYFLVFEDNSTSLKSKGVQMTLLNLRKLRAETLGNQLLEMFFPKTEDNGETAPFAGYIKLSNMIMGANSINAHLAYGTMTTRYTNDKRIRPVFFKRTFVPYRHQKNVQYSSETIDKIPRILTIPHNFMVDLDKFSIHVYRDLKL